MKDTLEIAAEQVLEPALKARGYNLNTPSWNVYHYSFVKGPFRLELTDYIKEEASVKFGTEGNLSSYAEWLKQCGMETTHFEDALGGFKANGDFVFPRFLTLARAVLETIGHVETKAGL